MAWSYEDRSFSFERKVFSISMDKFYRGSRARITEQGRDNAFSISIYWASLIWLVDMFHLILETPLNHKFFHEKRGSDYTLWMEKTSNKCGFVVELTVLNSNGRKNRVIIPSGTDKQGWSMFSSLIQDFPAATPNSQSSKAYAPFSPPHPSSTPSYKEILTSGLNSPPTTTHKPSANNTKNLSTSTLPRPDDINDFDWGGSIIIFRKSFKDDWYNIRKCLHDLVSPYCSINPFQPNKAMLRCQDEDQARILCLQKGWRTVGPFQLMFVPWSQEAFLSNLVVPSFGGWIKIRNLPLNLWNIETFQFIGDACGGFLEYAHKTIRRLDLMEASIKVKGNFSGFIPAVVSLPSSLSSSICEVTIDPFFNPKFLLRKLVHVHGEATREADTPSKPNTVFSFSPPSFASENKDKMKQKTDLKELDPILLPDNSVLQPQCSILKPVHAPMLGTPPKKRKLVTFNEKVEIKTFLRKGARNSSSLDFQLDSDSDLALSSPLADADFSSPTKQDTATPSFSLSDCTPIFDSPPPTSLALTSFIPQPFRPVQPSDSAQAPMLENCVPPQAFQFSTTTPFPPHMADWLREMNLCIIPIPKATIRGMNRNKKKNTAKGSRELNGLFSSVNYEKNTGLKTEGGSHLAK